jgi:hypothetical protein
VRARRNTATTRSDERGRIAHDLGEMARSSKASGSGAVTGHLLDEMRNKGNSQNLRAFPTS